MKKEDLLNEMYLLLRKFDDDMLQLMNLFRKNDELQDEISVDKPIQLSESVETKTKTFSVSDTSATIKVGDMFVGTVVRIIPIGAFVEFAPGKDGMIHISKLSNQRVERVEDVLNIGDTVKVEIIRINNNGVDFRLLEKISVR